MIDALGIINFEDSVADIAGITDYRTTSAVSFMGRYRLIDFVLSNMSNSGIQQIQIYVKNKPRSVIEHVGVGAQYNINPKRGRMHILYGESNFRNEVYNHDVANFNQCLHFIEEVNCQYVVIAPSYLVYRCDYSEILKQHVESGNDITLLYKNTDEAKTQFLDCDVVTLDKDKRVVAFEKNRGKYKNRNISLECYIMSKKLFIELIRRAANTSALYWLKDILADCCMDYKIGGVAVKGYVGCINSMKSYLRESLYLSKLENASELFKDDWPIYTKTSDSSPTHYAPGAKVSGCSVSNGCYIEGTIENCVLGRNVVVKKGAIVKNCILLQGAYIGENAKLENVVVDKEAIVHHVKKLVGTEDAPIYVKRRDRI